MGGTKTRQRAWRQVLMHGAAGALMVVGVGFARDRREQPGKAFAVDNAGEWSGTR